MKYLRLSALIFGLMFCGSAGAVTRTSVGSGLASAAGTWDTGVPVDGDAIVVANTHDVEWDIDTSAWVGLAASTINAGGTLHASTTAGAYVLKMNADLTVNGTLRAGTSLVVPYPSTCTSTVNLSSGSNSIVINNTTGNVQFFCVEPTIKYIKLNAQEAAAQTVLSVDTDVTGDATWAAGTTVFIADSTATLDRETATLSSTSATTITIGGGGLAAQKEIGTVIALITRNIRVIDSTDYAFKNGITVPSHVDCEMNNIVGGFFSTYNASIGGSILTTSTSSSHAIGNTITSCDFDGVVCNTSSSGTQYGGSILNNCTFAADSLIAGFRTAGLNNITNCTAYGLIQNTGGGVTVGKSFSMPGDLVGMVFGFFNTNNFWFTGTSTNITNRTFDNCNNFNVGSAELSNTVGGGAVSSSDLYYVTSARLFNTLFQGTTEVSGYGAESVRTQWDYIESFDHDQVVNAYKAWVLGGIVSSQTVSPPTGYTIWYELACESATYPCFRQYQTVVQPGTAIEVEGLIRIADAEDHTAYPPRLQIIDAFADPLVDSTQSPLDESQVADPDGSDSSWQTVSVIWANQGDAPRTVIVRMIAKHATGDVDTVWAVADYQNQIATILSVVRPVSGHVATGNTATSFTVDFGQVTADAYNNMTMQVRDADTGFWEERTITDWTVGKVVTVDTAYSFTPAVNDQARITATSYGSPVDNSAIATAVWTHNISAYSGAGQAGTYLDTLYDDWINGGRLDLLIDAIKAITDVLQAVNSTVQTPNDANNFIIANTGDINDVNDAYNGMTVYIEDATTGDWESRLIETWETGREITVDVDFTFTPDTGDVVIIWGTSYFPIGVYDSFPLPRETTHTVTDRTAGSAGGGTTTLDEMGDDP